METRANHVLIGLFTLGVALAAFGFVWWFAGRAAPSSRMTYHVEFKGSVSGLTQGSTVTFDGLRVGEVSGIRIDPKRPNRIVATISVDNTTPMRTNTKAELEFQGLTGVSSIALSGADIGDSKPLPGNPTNPPIIMGQTSAMQDLMAGARHVLEHVDTLATSLNQVVATNSPVLAKSVANIERFTGALADNSDNVGKFLQATGQAATAITGLSKELTTLSVKARDIIQNVDPKQVGAIVDNTSKFSDQLAKSAPRLGEIADNASSLARNLATESKQLGGTLKKLDAIVAAVDPKQIGTAVDSISAFTKTLDAHRQDFDQIATSAAALSARANAIVQNVDPKKIGAIVDNTATFSGQLAKSSPKIGAFADSAEVLSKTLVADSRQLGVTLSKIQDIVDGVDPKKVGSAVDNVTAFTQTLDEHRDDISAIVKNTRDLTATLDATSKKLDSVIDNANTVLHQGAKSGVFGEVRDAAKSIRVLADHLDQRTKKLTDEISSVTGPSARGLQAVLSAARDAVASIDRVARELERNPQRFLFGGSKVRDYRSGG